MKKLFSVRTVAMVLAAAFLAAQAQLTFAAVSDEGAGDIKKQVEQAIAIPLDMQKSTGMGLVLGGPVEVSSKGDYYEVKLPSVSYAVQGMKADFGTLVLNVIPSGDEYKTTLALPPTITLYDASKAPVAEIKFGDQHFSGIWQPKYRAFTGIDAEYKDISVTSGKPEDKVAINVGNFKTTLKLTPTSADVWSGPANFDMTGIRLTAGDKGQVNISIDSMNGSATYDKLNMQTRKDMEDKTEQVILAAQKGEKPDPAQTQAMLGSMLTSLKDYINGMGSSFKLSGLNIKVNPGDEKGADGKPEKPLDVHLGSVSWGFDMAGMQEEKGNISLKFGMEGLSVPNMDAGTASIVPTASNVEVHLDNLPFQAMSKGLSELFSQVVSSAVATQTVTDAAQRSALQSQVQAQVAAAMITIPQQLATAGSKLSIVNTYANAPDVGSTLDGSFVANAASPVLAQGSITLLITGLDEVIVKLQSLAQGANADPKLMSMAQGLGMLQMMGGAPTKAADGRSQHAYKLEVSPEGKVMLNGADFGGAMGALGMGAPHAPAPGGAETPTAPQESTPEKTP